MTYDERARTILREAAEKRISARALPEFLAEEELIVDAMHRYARECLHLEGRGYDPTSEWMED